MNKGDWWESWLMRKLIGEKVGWWEIWLMRKSIDEKGELGFEDGQMDR